MWKRIKAYKKVILTTALIAFSIGLIAEAFIEYQILRHDISLASIVALSVAKWASLYILYLSLGLVDEAGKINGIMYIIHCGIVLIIYGLVIQKIVNWLTVDVDSIGVKIWGLYVFIIILISHWQAKRIMDKN